MANIGRISIALHDENKKMLNAYYEKATQHQSIAMKDSFNSFVNKWMAVRLGKAEFLEQTFPNISYAGIHGDLMLLRDNDRDDGDEVVEIKLNEDGQPECPKCLENKTGCMHAIYAAAKPELYQLSK